MWPLKGHTIKTSVKYAWPFDEHHALKGWWWWWFVFCGMVDRRKTFSLISNREHCQRSYPSLLSDMSRAGFEPEQNLRSGFFWIKLCNRDNHYSTALLQWLQKIKDYQNKDYFYTSYKNQRLLKAFSTRRV